MARPAQGSVERVPGSHRTPTHYKTRVRLGNVRPWVHLPPNLTEHEARDRAVAMQRAATTEGFVVEYVFDPSPGWRPLVALADGTLLDLADHEIPRAEEGRVRERAAAIASKVRAGGYVPKPPTTVDEWFEQYHRRRESKGQKAVGDARARYRNWIAPIIGPKAMSTVTRADTEDVRDGLDKAVAEERISWKTAKNIWGEMTSGFGEACSSKMKELRVRDDNPTENVQGPDRGVSKEGPILYPDEVAKLLACRDVPLARRSVYGIAIYTGARASELRALTVDDVDVEHGQLTISKQLDRRTRVARATKTGYARTIAIEPAVLPLFERLVRQAEEEHEGEDPHAARLLLTLPPDELQAEYLRRDLRTAGVTRARLFVGSDNPTQYGIVFHSLRHTCLTWMAARGDEAMQIQWRGGHMNMKTTQGYLLAGRTLGAGFGTPFPAVPTSLVEGFGLREWTGRRWRAGMPGHSEQLLGRPQRDSNPC